MYNLYNRKNVHILIKITVTILLKWLQVTTIAGSLFHKIVVNFFNKNAQPQIEDYAHVCRELYMCVHVLQQFNCGVNGWWVMIKNILVGS